jgi:hypothetical protein
VSVYFWNSVTLTYGNPKNVQGGTGYCVGMAVSADGSRIAASSQNSYIYSAYWDSVTQNYTELKQTLHPINIGDDYGNLAMSNDGSIIVFGPDTYGRKPVYWAKWDDSLKTYGVGIQIKTNVDNFSCAGFAISSDKQVIIIISSRPNVPSRYNIFDSDTQKYKPSVEIPDSAIPIVTRTNGGYVWLSRDDSKIYFLTGGFVINESSISLNYKSEKTTVLLLATESNTKLTQPTKTTVSTVINMTSGAVSVSDFNNVALSQIPNKYSGSLYAYDSSVSGWFKLSLV